MQKHTWSPPGWPWELELLALIFVITAIIIPIYVGSIEVEESTNMSLIARAEMEKQRQVGVQWANTDFFWTVVIVGMYLAHLGMAGASVNFISTPFTHLVSPLIFGMITYYRLFQFTKDTQIDTHIVRGEPWEIFLWVLGILVITFMVARIRMARHMLRFRDVAWELSTPTAMDSSYFSLVPHLTPLLYTPRVYRACPDGVLVEGRLYVMPIPFEAMQSLASVKRSRYTTSGHYLATSAKHLVRIQLTDKPEPFYISPKHREAFMRYCEEFAAQKSPLSSRPGDTSAGSSTAGGTKNGTKAGTRGGHSRAQLRRQSPTKPGSTRPGGTSSGSASSGEKPADTDSKQS